MGLAYDLKVEEWSGLGDYISEGIISLAGKDPQDLAQFPMGDCFSGSEPGGSFMYRFCGSTALGTSNSQAIFPTGEYIIRDITFMNGYYITVGSYKAYFRDLYGAGNHGYAWDGFIMPIRGYSYNLNTTAPFLYNKETKAYAGLTFELGLSGWGFLPMRMPLDIQPGALADATAVANDSSVGLQSIDIAKGREGVEIGGIDGSADGANIKIGTVGFQRVGDPVAEGMVYTNIDYIPFLWVAQLFEFRSPTGAVNEIVPVAGYPYTGGDPREDYGSFGDAPFNGNVVFYFVREAGSMKTAWSATTNHTMLRNMFSTQSCEEIKLFDLQDWVGASAINTGGQANYPPDLWQLGFNAAGVNYLGLLPPDQDASALTFGMLPRRWLGIRYYSQQEAFGADAFNESGPFQIVGDAYLGGDPSIAIPVTTQTVPTQCGCIYSVERLALDWCGTDTFDKVRMGPYIIQHNAGVSYQADAFGGVSEWEITTQVTSGPISFNGAYCLDVVIPYERMIFEDGSGTPNPSNKSALRQYFVNGLKPTTGILGAGIFAGEEYPQNPNCPIRNIIVPTQPDVASAGFPNILKSKWYSTVAQSRTFTEDEERISKVLNYFQTEEAGYGGLEEPIFVTNANNNERVGVFGNYQRLGLDEDPTGEVAAQQQQGNPSRQAFGGLSQTKDTLQDEPVVFMFDSGRGWMKDKGLPVTDPNYANPPNYSNIVLNVGATFNDKFIIGKDSTTRKAVWGGWDNDRDQWLYLFSDTTNGMGAISATSTFNAASNNDGFLDQTDNFVNRNSNFSTLKTAMWHPFIMTNELDGLVIVGSSDLDNTSESIFGYTGDGANNPYWVYAYGPATTTQTVPIPGFSGVGYGSNPLSSRSIDFTASSLLTFVIKGTTGRQAEVWVDYILFDGADALIATKLRERGMKVTIEAVEWFKRKIINSGDLNIKQEEIEDWMRQQQDEFQMMMRDAERMGRVRKKKKQVSAFGLDMLDILNTDFEDKEVQEFMKEYLPKSRPPTPEEQMLERQRKGGYSPQTKSYFDEVFEN